MKKDEHRYDDMLEMPRHSSTLHKHMSLQDRAAQFIPFQAVQGYDDAVVETARLTDEKIELSDSQKDVLDETVHYLLTHPSTSIHILYFVKDEKKEGGSYQEVTGYFKKIEEISNTLILRNKKRIPLSDILKIDFS